MKMSHLSFIVVMVVMIGVAFAGCTSSTPSAPAATGSPSGSTGAQAPQPPGAATTVAAGRSSSGGVSGSNPFGAVSYNWVEYKMASQGMTIYMKFDKAAGTCTMRFEGANVPQGMPSTMDCSSSGQKAPSNPNAVSSDVQWSDLGPSPVTVAAGTFADAEKYSGTTKGVTSYYWISKGKPLLKMESGSVSMELNGWG